MPNLTFNKMHLCGKVQTENGKKIRVHLESNQEKRVTYVENG
ncbi:MAG: hypothetical protein ACK52J_03395 [bacterium]|jgi:hypothetical protein